MKKLISLFAVLMGFASVANASLMLEPYLGYEMGTTKNSDGKYSGTQLGGRIGYASPVMVWVAADYTMGLSGTIDPDNGSSTGAKRSSLYGVVGVDLPILLRGWIGTTLSNEVKLDNDKYKGSATKIGFGFTGLPFVSLNFEYINEKFDKNDAGSLNPNFENNSYVLSVSLPLEF